MQIGVFTALWGNLSFEEALDKAVSFGITAVEIGAGGYPGQPHCPVDDGRAGVVTSGLGVRVEELNIFVGKTDTDLHTLIVPLVIQAAYPIVESNPGRNHARPSGSRQ